METITWAWLYQPRGNDPKGLKEVLDELREEEAELTELDFSDDYKYLVTKCMSVVNNESLQKTGEDGENEILIDFKAAHIELPKFVSDLISVDPLIKANDIRYVAFAGKGATEEIINDGKVIFLSIWMKEREIMNIYLEMNETKSSLLLVSAISRLIFETNKKSISRSHKFFPIIEGNILVAHCTVTERDQKENDYLSSSKKKKKDENLETDAPSEQTKEKEEEAELPPGKMDEIPLYFMIDEESLCLFRHPFSLKPDWDFRFYRDETPKSIDTIFICNNTGQLEIQQQQNVIYMRAEGKNEEDFKKLISCLKDRVIKTKSAEMFTDIEKFQEFFNETQTNTTPQQANTAGDQFQQVKRPKETAAVQEARASEPWLDSLCSGSCLQSAAEDTQVMWFEKAEAIEEIHKSGSLPDTNIESGGLDSNSIEHLLTAIEEIRTDLFSDQYGLALSLLDGCVKVFGSTLLSSVAHMDRVELIKRVFFLRA